VIYDWEAKPFCHKQMTLALRSWSHDNTNSFPNVEGASLRSMQAIAEVLHTATNHVFPNYNYIPGLQEGDPQTL